MIPDTHSLAFLSMVFSEVLIAAAIGIFLVSEVQKNQNS